MKRNKELHERESKEEASGGKGETREKASKQEQEDAADFLDNGGPNVPEEADEATGNDKKSKKEEMVTPLGVDEAGLTELEETKDRLLRLQAEFVNYKRRVEREKSELYVYGCETMAKDLLPVVDNVERALDSIREKDEAVYQGIDMIWRQMVQVLKKHQIEEIVAEGQPFDMNVHHAVQTEPCEDENRKNTVAEVLQKGYRMKERVLRPAMVKVYQ